MSKLLESKLNFWQGIIIAIITAIAGFYTANYNHFKVKGEIEQGTRNLTIEGKWKYICTSFDDTYQHGGRFYVQKDNNGKLILQGERVWKDTFNFIENKWDRKNYDTADYVIWHTNWIYVRDNVQIHFEYHIPSSDKLGYCTGIIESNNCEVKRVVGEFYLLKNNPILFGKIVFQKVNDSDYNKTTTLPKISRLISHH